VGRNANVQSFERALADCDVLQFDDAAGRLAGRIDADLETRGRRIDMLAMTGAIAIHHSIVLATGNVAHFEAVRAARYALTIDNSRER
jgi:predicted nucleic acid-binding protein